MHTVLSPMQVLSFSDGTGNGSCGSPHSCASCSSC